MKHVITYQNLRTNIGLLGLLLPIILAFGVDFEIKPSISHFYYTDMGVVFTGVLWVFGWLLISYRGYDSDNLITTIAGVLIIIVSLVPTAHLAGENQAPNAHQDEMKNYIHLFSAGTFFILMGYMSFCSFTQESGIGLVKTRRRRIYRVSGVMVWLSIALLIPVTTLEINLTGIDVYLGETVALFFFGISWLVKSKSLKMIGL